MYDVTVFRIAGPAHILAAGSQLRVQVHRTLPPQHLQRTAAAIPLLEVLQAVEADPSQPPAVTAPSEQAGEQVALALERRLQLALERELARLTLEELLYDLRSTQECLRQEGGLMLG